MHQSNGSEHESRRPVWRRPWFVILTAVVALLIVVGALGEDPERPADKAATLGDPTPVATEPAATPDPADDARAEAARLAGEGRFLQAVTVLEAAGLDDGAERVARRGSQVLYRRGRNALALGHFKQARRLAMSAGDLRAGKAVATLVETADAKLAAAREAARERRRQARLARDLSTCDGGEKDAVRAGTGVPAGCTAFAAELEARRAEEEAEAAAASQCDPNYAGACLDPGSPDYDCEGGSGDGPDYVGTVQVVGSDIHDLDRDGDGIACDT